MANSATTAVPSISADAVPAVRRGLRIALRRASLPDLTAEHRDRHPDHSRSPAARRRDRPARPRSTSAAIRARPSCIAESAVSASGDDQRDAAGRSPARRARPARSTAPERSTSTSRSAASGATRLALIAGVRLAISVTATPTTIEAMTVVLVERECRRSGCRSRRRSSRALRPLASPRPAKSPMPRRRCRHQRLDHHGRQHLAPRGAERTQQGRLAGALGDHDRQRVVDREGRPRAAPRRRTPAGTPRRSRGSRRRCRRRPRR